MVCRGWQHTESSVPVLGFVSLGGAVDLVRLSHLSPFPEVLPFLRNAIPSV